MYHAGSQAHPKNSAVFAQISPDGSRLTELARKADMTPDQRMPWGAGAPEWTTQADSVARICLARIPSLVGVYVHGSAALGGFGPASDLDVLVIADSDADWPDVGAHLLTDRPHDRPLELSVVAASDASQPSPPWPYHLHVNSGESRFGLGAGRGDPDLIAHYAVTRAAGIPIYGPSAETVIGPIPRGELVDYLRGELQWGVDAADQRYAVLNACRAVAYAQSGQLLSKLDGGRWWLRQLGADPLVEEALTAQRDGRDLGRSSPEARSFVAAGIALLE